MIPNFDIQMSNESQSYQTVTIRNEPSQQISQGRGVNVKEFTHLIPINWPKSAK